MRRVDSLSTLRRRRRRHVEGVGRLTDFQLRRKSPCFKLGADTHHKDIQIKENMSWILLREFCQFMIPKPNIFGLVFWTGGRLFETKIIWGSNSESIYHWQNVRNLHFFGKYNRNLQFFRK